MSRVLKIIVTFFLGLFAFVFFLLAFFPLRPIFNHFLAGMESLTQGQYRIAVERMEPSLIFDSVFEGVVVSRKTKAGFEDFIAIEKMDVDVSLFSLITKTVNLDFEADLAGGSIAGTLKAVDAKNQIDVKLDDLKLAEMPQLKDPLASLGVFFTPEADLAGDVFLSFSAQGLRDAEAEFNLKLKKFKLNQTQVRLSNDPAAKPLDFSNLELSTAENPAILQGSLVNAQIRIHEFKIPGPDLDLELKGKFSLKEEKNDTITLVRSDIKGRFALSEKVRTAAPIVSLLDAQKGADGYYPLTISGKLDKPGLKIGEMDLGALFNADGALDDAPEDTLEKVTP